MRAVRVHHCNCMDIHVSYQIHDYCDRLQSQHSDDFLCEVLLYTDAKHKWRREFYIAKLSCKPTGCPKSKPTVVTRL